jgi:hypothetical protein
VKLLRDGQAVRQEVVKKMDRLVRESKKGDLVIITYSGHGMRVPTYKRWLGLEADQFQSQILMANYGPQNAGEIP